MASLFNVKSGPNSRLTELSQQAQLIEERKREIERKLALKSNTVTVPITSSQRIQNPSCSGKPRPNKLLTLKTEVKDIQTESNDSSSNVVFKNDGSFLEQFKKMQAKTVSPEPSSPQCPMITCSQSSASKAKQKILMKLKTNPPPSLSPNITIQEKLSSEEIPKKENGNVSPPEDQAVRWAVEKVAISVAINGATAEEAARKDNQDNTSYMFLNDFEGETYKYYQHRLSNLKEAKLRAEDDGIGASMINPNTNDASISGEPQSKKRRRSRWDCSDSSENSSVCLTLPTFVEKDPALVAYAMQVFGSTALSYEQWKQLDDQRKMKVLFQMMQAKQRVAEANALAGKVKYEYDSDEEVDGGTWEHKKRATEMDATKTWADDLTSNAKGKHHIGDFLPPEELEKFMEKWEALKEGRSADLSDYKEHKLTSDNVGYQMLQKLGWAEGQGLGTQGVGITAPVNKGAAPVENSGLGQGRPDEISCGDDEYEAYRKRMMLAYRFRPNPLNNPRRAYY